MLGCPPAVSLAAFSYSRFAPSLSFWDAESKVLLSHHPVPSWQCPQLYPTTLLTESAQARCPNQAALLTPRRRNAREVPAQWHVILNQFISSQSLQGRLPGMSYLGQRELRAAQKWRQLSVVQRPRLRQQPGGAREDLVAGAAVALGAALRRLERRRRAQQLHPLRHRLVLLPVLAAEVLLHLCGACSGLVVRSGFNLVAGISGGQELTGMEGVADQLHLVARDTAHCPLLQYCRPPAAILLTEFDNAPALQPKEALLHAR